MPHFKHLGIGAIVSFQSKFMHPKSLRDEYLQDKPSSHRLVNAVVIRRQQKKINHKDRLCVIIHHNDFVDQDGNFQDLWCAESHVKVHKEGDPAKFFNESIGQTCKEDDEDVDDLENQKQSKNHDHGKRMSIDPNGFDDPLRPREGRDLMWRNVNMTLRTRNKKIDAEKKILDSVWGDVPSKQVTAIMGPSGSGKTSLLNILAGRASSNGNVKIDADIRLNNYVVDPTRIEVRNNIAFVAQDDSLQVTATPREAIRFSGKMRLPRTMTDEALDNLTEIMLEELGLVSCADVLVGGALLKGISGGERKRTSVGVELVTHPALVFLDEPTSGLDSHNALQLCQLLKRVAQAGSSILFTIHQPSSEIFSSFDHLILLNQGRVMYQGLTADVPAHFEELGFPCPQHYNPADHVMHIALENSIVKLQNSGFFPNDTRKIGDPFKVDEDANKDPLGITLSSRGEGKQDPPPGLVDQTYELFKREIKNLVRNTHTLRTRTVMTVVISLTIGCLFWQVADNDFSEFINAQSTFGALLMSLTANIFSTALPSLVAFPEERPVFLREYSTNHYSVVSYFVSRLTVELTVNAVQVTVSTITTYFMVGFHLDYWVLWTAVYLLACASSALGVMVGSATESASTAIELLPAVFMPQILFSGFFVPPALIPNWLSWLVYIMPLTYGVRILLAGEFGGDRCDNVETFPDGTNSCTRILGNSGSNPEDVWWYYLVLLGLFIVFRLFALFVLKKKASKFY
ncbi:ABC transporter [Nitzschia inconspicua]|uniref:ABC transporter n=1 Tax=Nitzschia inconspicua TaxID=303405 RepID=A0A9K3KTI4_9STRA|nr:ABC transporter [Nitzschia inconspicua]